MNSGKFLENPGWVVRMSGVSPSAVMYSRVFSGS